MQGPCVCEAAQPSGWCQRQVYPDRMVVKVEYYVTGGTLAHSPGGLVSQTVAELGNTLCCSWATATGNNWQRRR